MFVMKPLSAFDPAALREIRGVFCDIDDTITTDGRLPAVAYHALERLKAAGLLVAPITGRPAGWCDLIARFWPVDGVVGENGAFYFRYDHQAKHMTRRFSQDAPTRATNRKRLFELGETVLKAVPGTAIASDQLYREVDIAIDFCEDVPPLPPEAALRIKALFDAEGATAKISSIHVNAWFGRHDKLSMTRQFLAETFGIDIDRERERYVFVGDSPNDAPMFGHFPNAVGVANIRKSPGVFDAMPAYVTKSEGGQGFAEVAAALLAARSTP
jgi:HAD superfamily hydrolase (TIGR01484 family)